MLTVVEAVDSKPASPSVRVSQLVGVVSHILSVRHRYGQYRVQASQIGITSPGIVVGSITNPLLPQYHLLSYQHLEYPRL
jgi:hypothetical protein